LTGFGSKASSLVCRLESLGIPLKARFLRESNRIEEGGTGSQKLALDQRSVPRQRKAGLSP